MNPRRCRPSELGDRYVESHAILFLRFFANGMLDYPNTPLTPEIRTLANYFVLEIRRKAIERHHGVTSPRRHLEAALNPNTSTSYFTGSIKSNGLRTPVPFSNTCRYRIVVDTSR